jgi:hypothetical protein
MIKHAQEEGLIKLTFSEHVNSSVGASMRLKEDPDVLVKSASSAFNCDSDDIRPDKDHVGIHVVALGDYEHFGVNRNGDAFSKRACIDYHDTFEKHANVFLLHNNNDPEKKVGDVVKSAYNAPMGRIELIIHAHKDKAQDQLHKLATTGEHAFSMGCKVAFDRCGICNTIRKNGSDPNQCEHIRDHLGETFSDGKVACTFNDEPHFFDISFVNRPADRIAWSLKQAGAETPDAVKMASSFDMQVPDALMQDVPNYREKVKIAEELARIEGSVLSIAEGSHTADAMVKKALASAVESVPPAALSCLRGYEPEEVIRKLAEFGVVLGPEDFFKYAMGCDYGPLENQMDRILADSKSCLFSRLMKTSAYKSACRNVYFDVDTDYTQSYGANSNSSLHRLVKESVANVAGATGQRLRDRIIQATICGRVPDLTTLEQVKEAGTNVNKVHKGAEIYAAYKLSAVLAARSIHREDNPEQLLTFAAVQNLV